MSKLDYGVVKIIGGKHKGRIGFYDDEDDNPKNAIVYFTGFVLLDGYYCIPHRFLRKATLKDLLHREHEIRLEIAAICRISASLDEQTEKKVRLLLVSEAYLISQQLALHRFIWKEQSDPHAYIRIIKVFISYASKDKEFAKHLAQDLESFGLTIWFDEWEIHAGDSIPKKLGSGSEDADFMLIIFSKNSKTSRWQEKEWESKFIDEVSNDNVCLIPLKLEECEIPQILKAKRYVDFIGATSETKKYDQGLQEILKSIRYYLDR